jgi:hypothetical protein
MPLPVALRVAALDRVIAFLHVRFPAAEGAVARLVVVPVVPIATGAPGQTPGGHMIRGLLAVAYATGVMGHSLPGPQGTFN